MPVTQPVDSIDLKRRNRLTQGHKLRSSTSWLGNSAGSKIAKSAKSLQKLLRPELLKMVSSKVHAREPSLSTEEIFNGRQSANACCAFCGGFVCWRENVRGRTFGKSFWISRRCVHGPLSSSMIPCDSSSLA